MNNFQFKQTHTNKSNSFDIANNAFLSNTSSQQSALISFFFLYFPQYWLSWDKQKHATSIYTTHIYSYICLANQICLCSICEPASSFSNCEILYNHAAIDIYGLHIIICTWRLHKHTHIYLRCSIQPTRQIFNRIKTNERRRYWISFYSTLFVRVVYSQIKKNYVRKHRTLCPLYGHMLSNNGIIHANRYGHAQSGRGTLFG